MSEDFITATDGRVLTVTLNDPENGNAISDAGARALAETLLEAPATADVIVLRGAGRDFCTGRSRRGRPQGGPVEALERRRQSDVIFDCYAAFTRTAIPVIGVVQGAALGFGCSLAASCDITIASDAATFQIPEMGHNTMPTMVMSALYDRVPAKALKYLVYTTEVIGAERALMLGIVSDVAPAADLEARLDAVLARMLKTPRPALEGVKEYLRSAPHLDPQGALDYARSLHAMVNASSEMKKG